jgi:hypothetical protein
MTNKEIDFIEDVTDYDIIHYDDYEIEVINRYDEGDETIQLDIYCKTVEEVIRMLRLL